MKVQNFRYIHFQWYFPNLNLIFVLVYFHVSFHAVSSISVVFQYCRPILNSSIPLTVSPIPLFLLQFLPLVLCKPTVKFPIFIMILSLLFLSKFYYFFPVFFVILLFFSLYYSRTRFIFRHPLNFPFPCGVFDFFLAVFPLCLRLDKLAPSSRYDSEPALGRPPSAALALPACRQFPLLPT